MMRVVSQFVVVDARTGSALVDGTRTLRLVQGHNVQQTVRSDGVTQAVVVYDDDPAGDDRPARPVALGRDEAWAHRWIEHELQRRAS